MVQIFKNTQPISVYLWKMQFNTSAWKWQNYNCLDNIFGSCVNPNHVCFTSSIWLFYNHSKLYLGVMTGCVQTLMSLLKRASLLPPNGASLMVLLNASWHKTIYLSFCIERKWDCHCVAFYFNCLSETDEDVCQVSIPFVFLHIWI